MTVNVASNPDYVCLFVCLFHDLDVSKLKEWDMEAIPCLDSLASVSITPELIQHRIRLAILKCCH